VLDTSGNWLVQVTLTLIKTVKSWGSWNAYLLYSFNMLKKLIGAYIKEDEIGGHVTRMGGMRINYVLNFSRKK